MSTFKLSSFLRFGADLRAEARACLQQADQQIAAARQRIEQARELAGEPLRRIDATRMAVFDRSIVAIQELHRGGSVVIARTAPLGGQAERLAASAPTAPASPTLPGATSAIAIAVLAAAGVGAATVALVPSLGIALPLAGAGAVALLLSMGAACRVAQANVRRAAVHQDQARRYDAAADAFAARASAVHQGADDACRAIELLGDKADAARADLQPALMDAANAAVLLRKVLEMALLDGDGALMPNIMASLVEHKASIQAFGHQIAAQPAHVA